MDIRPPRPHLIPRRNRPGSALDRAAELDRLDRLATLLDSRWRLPLLGWRFGLDSVIGLVPGLGDAAGGLLSAWLILRARRLGAPNRVLALMAGNVVLDVALGTVPVLGDVLDVGLKANRRNARLLRRHFERQGAGA
ncbi:hypothetical protein BWR60_26565 [Inquilinus limosus]|uniref:DUF4112 domain-containing protein n=1 Tax=Inquilinus limosus TaxID=171674 RepID=A0A211ZFN6_9PROT|nr:hypothetical protein BWR60_26565 [Inquilinus limosus]